MSSIRLLPIRLTAIQSFDFQELQAMPKEKKMGATPENSAQCWSL